MFFKKQNCLEINLDWLGIVRNIHLVCLKVTRFVYGAHADRLCNIHVVRLSTD